MASQGRGASFLAGAKFKVFGAAFLALLVFFVWLTYAIFSKKFVAFDEVSLKTSSIGLQLPARADVKIRGVAVGEVTDIATNGKGATLTLGIIPSEAATIPANVTARILPKTLFGEKYVALQMPANPAQASIKAGDTIRQATVAIEVEKVLNDLYPLLRTVQPAQLNYTLTAIANALEGQGNAIGNNLVVLDNYLKKMNPKVPLLVDDLIKLGKVSDTYAQVAPDLATILRNSVTTGTTFVQKQQKVTALFNNVAGLSNTTRDFLQRNGTNIITLSKQGQRQLPLLAKYAPEYPCLFRGLTNSIPREEGAFRGHELHINLEVLKKQPRGYNPGDEPAYADRRGPVNLNDCTAAISGRYGQNNLPPNSLIPNIKDGVNYPLGKQRPAPGFDMSSGYSGTRAERSVVDSVAGPAMGVPVNRVPDVASLLFGPLARGAEVSLR